MTYPHSADWNKVPHHMRDGLKRYFDHGIEPGSFMTAVLCNDLRESFGRADDINREALEEARVQVEQLHTRLGIKETKHGTLAIIDAAISKAKETSHAE